MIRRRGAVARARLGAWSLVPPWLLAAAILVTVCFGSWLALAPGWSLPANDSYHYVLAVERILGDSGPQAQAAAVHWYCGVVGRGPGGAAGCVAHLTAAGGLAPNAPQYNEIFLARPGYPLLAAPFVAVFGIGSGLAIVAWLCAIGAAWLCLLVARCAGLRPPAALAAMIAFFLVPSFVWMRQYLTEGPTMVCTLVALLGTVWALEGRARLGLATAGAGYVVGFLVRYSTFSLQAGAILIFVLLLALCSGGRRDRRTYRVAAFNGIACVVMTALPPLLGWPGFANSIEDIYTVHFTRPVPPNLYHLWWTHLHSYLRHVVQMYLHEPLVLIPLLAGFVALWLRHRAAAAAVSAAALTGVLNALGHPALSQSSRLYYQVFLLTVFGAAAIVDLVEHRARSRLRPAGRLDAAAGAPESEALATQSAAQRVKVT